MNPRHRPCHLVLAVLLAATSALRAQTPAPAQTVAPRIRGPIEPTPSVPLRGSLNPHIRSADDLGPLPPDTVIPGVTLVFSRSPEQQAALDQLLTDQTNPSSPLFHHWLTPSQFAARFGPAPADVAATQAWLQSRGFTVDPVAPAAGRITFSGTAAQIHQAFNAELHRFRSPAPDTNPAADSNPARETKPAELHFAPASELALPAALAPVTAAILHLSDFRPKPNVRPRPNFTAGTAQTHYLDPQDLGNMYDVWPIDETNSQITGQALAILGQTFVRTGDSSMIGEFSRYLGGGYVTPILVPNSGVEAIFDGDLGESEIDLEYGSVFAGGIGGAKVFLVYTGSSTSYDVFDALAYAITQNIAPVISLSYSECEPMMSSAELQQGNALLQQAAAQGQTVVAASGDQGATACIYYGSSSGLSTAQIQGAAVNFPASSPYVTAVGGTQMAPETFAAGSTNQYWASTPAIMPYAVGSLTGYVPEIAWNEDSPTQGIFSSGGGASSVFARPSWQSGVPGIPAGNFRLLPDVALQASAANPGFIICSDDPYLTGGQNDCSDGLQFRTNTYLLNGGTSFAAPVFAGALLVVAANAHAYGLGNINPVLYGLAAQPGVYASVFHDITSGNTSCLSAETDCSPAGQSGFAAGIGYDQTTGLGSLDFAKLSAAWPAGPPSTLLSTAITFTDNETIYNGTSAPPDSSVSITVGVGNNLTPGVGAVPTGAISVSLDGQALSPSSSLTVPPNTSAFANTVYTFNAPSTSGSHILHFDYPGDSTHLPSSGTFALTVGSAVAAGSVTLSAPSLSLSSNSLGSSQVSISPSGGYNGYLNWTISMTGTVATTFCYLVDAPPVSGVTSATVHLGVGTACDSPASLQSRSTSQRASLDPHSAPHKPARPSLARNLPAAPVLALLLFTLLPRGRRKPLPLLAALVLISLPLTLAGCGGASGTSGGGGGGGGSQAQTYTVTLTAKDSVQTSITASTTFTLTVN